MQAPGTDPGFEAAVSACVSAVTRLVHDGYAVEVIDTDGTMLAERIDGGDMTEVEGLRHAVRDRSPHAATITSAGSSRVFAGVMTGPVVLIVGRFDPADAETIAPVAHHSTLPMLLAVGSGRRRARPRRRPRLARGDDRSRRRSRRRLDRRGRSEE